MKCKQSSFKMRRELWSLLIAFLQLMSSTRSNFISVSQHGPLILRGIEYCRCNSSLNLFLFCLCFCFICWFLFLFVCRFLVFNQSDVRHSRKAVLPCWTFLNLDLVYHLTFSRISLSDQLNYWNFVSFRQVFEVKRQMRSVSDTGSQSPSAAYSNGSAIPALDHERNDNAVVV